MVVVVTWIDNEKEEEWFRSSFFIQSESAPEETVFLVFPCLILLNTSAGKEK